MALTIRYLGVLYCIVLLSGIYLADFIDNTQRVTGDVENGAMVAALELLQNKKQEQGQRPNEFPR